MCSAASRGKCILSLYVCTREHATVAGHATIAALEQLCCSTDDQDRSKVELAFNASQPVTQVGLSICELNCEFVNYAIEKQKKHQDVSVLQERLGCSMCMTGLFLCLSN